MPGWLLDLRSVAPERLAEQNGFGVLVLVPWESRGALRDRGFFGRIVKRRGRGGIRVGRRRRRGVGESLVRNVGRGGVDDRRLAPLAAFLAETHRRRIARTTVP